jgi:hypothetical protein
VATGTYRYYRYVLIHGKGDGDDDGDNNNMWNVKTRVISVIMGRQESFQNHSENT